MCSSMRAATLSASHASLARILVVEEQPFSTIQLEYIVRIHRVCIFNDSHMLALDAKSSILLSTRNILSAPLATIQ